MSTDHMPNPPDQPTQQVKAPGVEALTQQPEQDASQPNEQAQPVSLAEDMARVIQSQVDIITQRLLLASEKMVAVGSVGVDAVNARNSTLIVADALRKQTDPLMEHTLVNLGYPEIAQVNDQTLPFKLNAQVAGLLEGILIDTLNKAYSGDAARQKDARLALQKVFIAANERMESQSKALIEFQAPGPGPNARD